MKPLAWIVYYLVRNVIWLAAKVLWRIRVKGRSNVPTNGAFLFCPVHRSNIDGPLMSIYSPQRMRYLSKKEMFKNPFIGRVISEMGAIPVDRGAPDRASLRLCLQTLEAGLPLVLFPEGGRRDGNTVVDVLDGAAYLALKAGVPVVPVGIAGSEEAQPRGKATIRPVPMSVVIGKPLHLEPGERQTASRAAVQVGVEQIRSELQGCFDEAIELNAGRGRAR
jgi:1-acyl-sn-glycerol-3-phosphate acyltransferase